MFATLSDRLAATFKGLRGKGRLSEADVDATVREIRMALLDADVALPVVRTFCATVKERALSVEVSGALNPAQQVVKIVHEELVAVLGGQTARLEFAKTGPTVILLAGLQGAGKTTLAGKLALKLRGEGHAPLLVAADLQRPNAVDQLKVVGERAGVAVFAPEPGNGVGDPVVVTRAAREFAETKQHDVVIVDTAGRLAVDADLMQQLRDVRDAARPDDVLLVVDAMIGQDAVNTARTFNDRLVLDGVILTKLDGDARGGAALSIREVTGKPIKFLGMGEQLEKLDEFRPEGLASRILGMGDIVGLMKDFEEVVDAEKAEEDAVRMLKGKFDMQDFLEQIEVIQKMGSLKDLFEKMPFFGGALPEGVSLDDKELVKIKAMISSMTAQERKHPELFVITSWQEIVEGGKLKKRKTADYHMDRVLRVAKGAGRKDAEVKELLHKFATMRGMMMAMGQQTGLLGKIPGLKQFAQMKQLGGIDVKQIMNAAGMERVAHRFTPPRIVNNLDKRKEKSKRKEARKQRKKQRKK